MKTIACLLIGSSKCVNYLSDSIQWLFINRINVHRNYSFVASLYLLFDVKRIPHKKNALLSLLKLNKMTTLDQYKESRLSYQIKIMILLFHFEPINAIPNHQMYFRMSFERLQMKPEEKWMHENAKKKKKITQQHLCQRNDVVLIVATNTFDVIKTGNLCEFVFLCFDQTKNRIGWQMYSFDSVCMCSWVFYPFHSVTSNRCVQNGKTSRSDLELILCVWSFDFFFCSYRNARNIFIIPSIGKLDHIVFMHFGLGFCFILASYESVSNPMNLCVQMKIMFVYSMAHACYLAKFEREKIRLCWDCRRWSAQEFSFTFTEYRIESHD